MINEWKLLIIKLINQHDLIKQIIMTWLNDFSWFNEVNEYDLVK